VVDPFFIACTANEKLPPKTKTLLDFLYEQKTIYSFGLVDFRIFLVEYELF
jgi:hypothetical protein